MNFHGYAAPESIFAVNVAKLLRLALTRDSLSRFCTTMQFSYEVSPAHELMIEYLERLIIGRIKKLAIILPPRSGKTLLGNIMAPAFVLGRDPTERIISVSYGTNFPKHGAGASAIRLLIRRFEKYFQVVNFRQTAQRHTDSRRRAAGNIPQSVGVDLSPAKARLC